MRPGHRQRRVVGGAIALLLSLAATPAGGAQGVGPAFTTSDVPLPKRVYDLGSAYVDGDRHPDLYTTAHNNRQVVLIGNGSGGFTDRLTPLGLDHTPAFPGLERFTQAPAMNDPGLYVFYRAHSVVAAASGAPARVTFRARGFESAQTTPGASASLKQLGDGDFPRVKSVVDLPAGGEAELKLETTAVPVRVNVKQAPATYVGSQAIPANEAGFRIELRDRHGMAWADLDADGDTDTYVVRGGLGGRIGRDPNLTQDRVMVQGPARFEDHQAALGVRKGWCRGRVASAVDADGDGRTDLSSSCKKDGPRLHLRRGGRFVGASAGLRRAGARGVIHRWVDVRGGPAPELVDFTARRARVYGRTRGGEWTRRQTVRNLPRGEVHSVAAGDYDRDADADLFVSTANGNALLRNAGGKLKRRVPPGLGLPAAGEGPLAWIDYQNDGLLDLYAPPGGIYEQLPNGRFAATGELATGELGNPRAVWTDVDSDGDRDGVLTARDAGKRFSHLYTNQLLGDHWLAVDVRGRGGARDAPGAQVTIRADGERQTGWAGLADTSRFSGGEHRVHFGLGEALLVDWVKVRWTDGERTRIDDVIADQRLTVERP